MGKPRQPSRRAFVRAGRSAPYNRNTECAVQYSTVTVVYIAPRVNEIAVRAGGADAPFEGAWHSRNDGGHEGLGGSFSTLCGGYEDSFCGSLPAASNARQQMGAVRSVYPPVAAARVHPGVRMPHLPYLLEGWIQCR